MSEGLAEEARRLRDLIEGQRDLNEALKARRIGLEQALELDVVQKTHLRELIGAARDKCVNIAGSQDDWDNNPQVLSRIMGEGLDVGMKFVRSIPDWLAPYNSELKLQKVSVEQLTEMVLRLLPGVRAEMANILCFVHPEVREYFEGDPWEGDLHPVDRVHLRDLTFAAQDKLARIGGRAESMIGMSSFDLLDLVRGFLCLPAGRVKVPKLPNAGVEQLLDIVLHLEPVLQLRMAKILCFVHPELVEHVNRAWERTETGVWPLIERVHLRELIDAARKKCTEIVRAAGIEGDLEELLTETHVMELLRDKGLHAGLWYVRSIPSWLSPCSDSLKLPATGEQLVEEVMKLPLDIRMGMANILCFVHPELLEQFRGARWVRAPVKTLLPDDRLRLQELIGAARDKCARIAGFEGDWEKLFNDPQIVSQIVGEGLDIGMKLVRSIPEWLAPYDWELKLHKASVEQLTEMVLKLPAAMRAEMANILCFVHPEVGEYFEGDPWKGELHPVDRVHLQELLGDAREMFHKVFGCQGDWATILAHAEVGEDCAELFLLHFADCLFSCNPVKLPKATAGQLMDTVEKLRLPLMRMAMEKMLCFVHPGLRSQFENKPWAGDLSPADRVTLEELIGSARSKCVRVARAAGIQGDREKLLFDPLVVKLVADKGLDAGGLNLLRSVPEFVVDGDAKRTTAERLVSLRRNLGREMDEKVESLLKFVDHVGLAQEKLGNDEFR